MKVDLSRSSPLHPYAYTVQVQIMEVDGIHISSSGAQALRHLDVIRHHIRCAYRNTRSTQEL